MFKSLSTILAESRKAASFELVRHPCLADARTVPWTRKYIATGKGLIAVPVLIDADEVTRPSLCGPDTDLPPRLLGRPSER